MTSPVCPTAAFAVFLLLAACGSDPSETRPAAPGSEPANSVERWQGCLGDGAAAIVNAFWTELDRNYAVFDLRLKQRSWDEIGREACASVSNSTSDEELFDVILKMAQSLDDGHIQITAPGLNRREAGWVTGYANWDDMSALEPNVEARYADGKLTRAANDQWSWGRIGSIGYLNLGAFEELSEGGDEIADTATAREAMARVMGDLGDVSGMVVDVRNNEGGWDDVGLEVAHWFAGPRVLTYTKFRRNGPGHDAFGDGEEVYVEASPENAFAGPVVLLLSGWTFSAAETFALSLRVRSNVTLLGEQTSGHFSDLERASLPNGWRYTYSAERYLAADGKIYEAQGVPPGIPIAFDPSAFSGGRDVMLEAALALLAR